MGDRPDAALDYGSQQQIEKFSNIKRLTRGFLAS